MALCDDLLAQKKQLTDQLDLLDADIAAAWAAAVIADAAPLTGGPAASNTSTDVQLRIDDLVSIYYGTTDQTIRAAAMNAIVAYQSDLQLLNQRLQVQTNLNNVVLQLLQNNCPLE